jgi:CHAT domain-containing protein
VKDGTSVRQVYADLNGADIAVARGDRTRGRVLYERALEAANGVAAVEWTAHAGLAQIAVLEQEPLIATRHFEAALSTVEKTRSDLLKVDYKLSFLTQLIEFYRNYVDALVARGQTDRALEIADSSRGRVLAERQRVAAPTRASVTALREVARRTRTVLLSYWLAPKRSFLWIVSGGGVRRVDLPPQAEIEAAVREYRAMLADALANPLAGNDTAGDRLFGMLVAPAALPRDASVIIVPDGALYSMNFETLPVDGPHRHYWIDDAEVQVAPSLSMLSAVSRTRIHDPRLLLIGNPTPRAPEFPALRYAPSEMRSIVRHFQQSNVTTYEDKSATPAVYRDAQLERFSMIHFTAHATANVESPLESAVVLSGPDTGYKLYARDVSDHPLNADLVTVSACRSAGERTYSGEGLVGFAWAFLRAGARRVIAGLWDVDDRSTARLMDELYGGLQAGHTPARSLRDAKLALIRDGGQLASPYYWGPFQLFTAAPD